MAPFDTYCALISLSNILYKLYNMWHNIGVSSGQTLKGMLTTLETEIFKNIFEIFFIFMNFY